MRHQMVKVVSDWGTRIAAIAAWSICTKITQQFHSEFMIVYDKFWAVSITMPQSLCHPLCRTRSWSTWRQDRHGSSRWQHHTHLHNFHFIAGPLGTAEPLVKWGHGLKFEVNSFPWWGVPFKCLASPYLSVVFAGVCTAIVECTLLYIETKLSSSLDELCQGTKVHRFTIKAMKTSSGWPKEEKKGNAIAHRLKVQ